MVVYTVVFSKRAGVHRPEKQNIYIYTSVLHEQNPGTQKLSLQGVSEKLGTLIEGESLFNDGSAIVVFEVFLGKLAFLSRFTPKYMRECIRT